MISKMFKYDFMDIGKKLIPFYAASLIVSFINRILITTAGFNSLSMENSEFSSYQHFVIQFQFLLYFLFLVIIFGITIMTVFIIITRYHNSIYGNEGYLTNTLPLNSAQIIFSKLINFLAWIFISGIVTMISVVALVPFELFFRILINDAEFYNFIINAGKVLADPKVFPVIIMYLFSVFFSQCGKILMLFLSVSIANLFKGNKIVIGIFSYMGISFLTSVISSFFTFFFVMTNQNNFKDGLLFPILNSGNIIIILFNLTVCIILFFAVYFLHKNKLDLE